VTKQKGFVLVDGDSDGRMKRLQVHAAHPEVGFAHLLAQALGDVDELRWMRGLEAQPLGDHHSARNAPSSSSRAGVVARPEAAAYDICSMACANATCTFCGAASASRREARARQRSPI